MLANDQEPSLVSVPQELTTTVAAKRLGISRPTLMKLIREGKIPAHKVRSHMRLLTTDVSIVQAIVRVHGGTISVKSRPGRTEFMVRLPLASAASAQARLSVQKGAGGH